MTRLMAAAGAATLAALLQTRDCSGNPPKVASVPPPAPTAIPTATAPPSPVPEPTVAADLFASVARPVLKTRCAPCHEPGGKLYDRLPFDNPKVISSHSEKVLGRLKGEDKEALQRWLATLKPGD